MRQPHDEARADIDPAMADAGAEVSCAVLARKNRVNCFASSASSTPTQGSITAIAIASSPTAALTTTRLDLPEYLATFDTRFVNTSSSSLGSPVTRIGAAGRAISKTGVMTCWRAATSR